MATTFDLSDMPAADAGDLAAAMRALIEHGRGLVLLNGADASDLDIVEAALRSRCHADAQRTYAAFVRFRHLVEVFGSRRLRQLFLDKGLAVMAPALAIAATQRLNTRRGFNPQQMLTAISAALASNVETLGSRPAGVEIAPARLRAA